MNLTLEDLELVNFKSHRHIKYTFHPGINGILGLNGIGKTNLLDGIYYSCLGKSYFSGRDSLVMKKGANFFRIVASFKKENHQEKFIAKVIPGKKKELSIDGKKIEKVGDHIGRFPCIIIAPSDIQLLLEGSEERRKFLNSSLIQYDPLYILHLIKYNKLLKQRNALLKMFSEKRYFDAALLESISIGMFEPAEYIFEARKILISEISHLFAKLYSHISGNKEDCNVEYKSSLLSKNLISSFDENIDKDRILGRTTSGIHKDDLIFKMNDDPIKPFGSQGQLKTFVLSLKLAQYHQLKKHNKIKPILLLDDLFDKLDSHRVKHLLTILQEEEYGQVFITDKDMNTIVELLEQISKEYSIFALDEDTSKLSEEE